MAGPDLDLQDPEQLAALLNATLFDEEVSADELRDQLVTLAESDNPVFAHVGVAPTGTSFDPSGAPLDATGAPTGGDSPDDATAGDGPDDVEVRTDGLTGLETAASPIRPGKWLWTDIDRRRSRDKYVIYRLEAKHTRREPIESVFTGRCQSVRVSLPMTPVDRDSYIGTFIGKVEASDHKLFSVQEVRQFYESACGTLPRVERVDLITGARFMGRRFSPVSIYLAFSDASALDLPCFYILEGGSAAGQPKQLYAARDMDTKIHQRAGFSFTPLACANNWYRGGLEMNAGNDHPARVFLTAAQEGDGRFDYLDLSVRYAVSKGTIKVVAPFELQVEAAMRVLAISEQIGCNFKVGNGGVLQPVLGPIAEALIPWDVKPRGSANSGERLRYCGCPKTGSTTVDPTPPAPPPERARPDTSTRQPPARPPARKPKPPT